ncbi:hypothetical protein CNY89_30175, partial [Amaricoccus sp. HAR-UPW-R2A-40]
GATPEGRRTLMVSATTVVIDEADDMLDLGFRAELDALLGATPEGRRTLMVSATTVVIDEADDMLDLGFRAE